MSKGLRKDGRNMNKKQNVTITMEADTWQMVRSQSARLGVSASALVSMVMGTYCLQQQAILDRLLNATPKELADFKRSLEGAMQ